MRRLRDLLICILLSVPVAYADTHTATEAYVEGRFREAAMIAYQTGQADGYALAARALLAEVIARGGEPDPAILEEAETYALNALQIDEAHMEGRLQLAIALSLKARPLSRIEAFRSGYGSRARELARGVLADDPDNAYDRAVYSHGFLSVWHIEVVRRGGRFGASLIGASVKSGRAHYQRAAALTPDDAALHWQYARALTALNARKYRDEIMVSLEAALAANTDDAIEEIMHGRAQSLKDALETLPARDVEAIAEQLL